MNESAETLRAFLYIKSHERELINKFAHQGLYIPDSQPVSLFMAGSPGAGKTETSKRLIETFRSKPVRIDADEIREFVPTYNASQAYLFQRAATKGVHILFDYAIGNNLSFVLDGTFAYTGALQNVERSLEHNRKVVIYYVYQPPHRAWEMVLAREAIEQRHVSKEVFIRSFVQARNNINTVKEKFGAAVQLNLIIKDLDAEKEKVELDILSVDQYLPRAYTEDELDRLV